MEYRRLPKGEEKISVLGLGTSSLGAAGEREMTEALELAVENGINYFDMASADAAPFPVYGKVLSGCRKDIFYQIHFGAEYRTGEYGWTTDPDVIRRSVDWQLEMLKTDYIDFGFLHCLDEEADLEEIAGSGVLEYIQQLKKEGTVRHIALSTHTPQLAERVLDMEIIDLLMFSINPGYDYHHGDYAIGGADERAALYRRCEAEGVGISVMKVFSGGQLLDAAVSPFGKALTEYQCIQYALDKPGVLTVLAGIRDTADLKRLLRFFELPPEEKDYSVIGGFTPEDAAGRCVYCNHCRPCPEGLNIGLINKYYDLAKAGDRLAADHYRTLSKRADSCIGCGHCDRRCPFHVKQSRRMKEIADYFG